MITAEHLESIVGNLDFLHCLFQFQRFQVSGIAVGAEVEKQIINTLGLYHQAQKRQGVVFFCPQLV